MKKFFGLICAMNLVCLSLSTSSLAGDSQIPPSDDSSPIRTKIKGGDFDQDALSVVLSNLTLPEMRGARRVCSDFRDAMPRANRLRMENILSELDKQFVTIPEGKLPNGTQIASFQADKYPVTQKLWGAIMGSLPQSVQANCPDCPITHVNWENQDGSPAEVQTFLAKLNERIKKSGCTYDLPTDAQLHYMIRGDVTGANTAKYSVAKGEQGNLMDVTDANVNQYVTHYNNSNTDGTGRRIQPVGQKTLNAFGIELGNVWKMSKDIYDPAHPEWGRSVRGGSWDYGVGFAESRIRLNADAGARYGNLGFSLVRTCR